MGCGSSQSGKETQVEKDRRRLSVGTVDKSGASNDAAAKEDVSAGDRGLIQILNKENALELFQGEEPPDASGRRRFSIGSQTDQGKTSFANKTVENKGEVGDVSGLGYTCRKGLKPESPNQDSFIILRVDKQFSIYGVFDGHGQKGHDVSEYVKLTLPKLLLRDPRWNDGPAALPQICKDAFKKIQNLIATAQQLNQMDAKLAGTTCTIAIHDHTNNKLTVAHVADSTAVLGRVPAGTKEIQAVQLTRDHKPDLKDERERIEKAGGRVVFDGYANHRVYAKNARYPGLNMSRCLGDLLGHWECGISCEPEVSQRDLGPEDTLLLLCSDGVWEFMSPQEAVQLVTGVKGGQAMIAAETLAKAAWDRWIREEGGAVVDDITVVLVQLTPENNDP